MLAQGLGEAERRGHRVRRAGVLLQGVRGQGENGRQGRRRLLVDRVDQEPVRVPAATSGLRVLRVHVDLVFNPLSPVYRADYVRGGSKGHAQHISGEYLPCT